ncbi:hypothetical protein [Micromonospora sonneratiae]|uniref:Lipoprotein n=1 Tax=Micromonospora sonneratiae TaxID=1184706 RepID=A0ABW3YIM6_9ACTN
MKRTGMVATVGLLVLALTGCGEDSGGSRELVPDQAPLPSASSVPTATSAPAGGGVSAAALCDYLRSELPGLKAVGSEVGAMAQLTMGLSGWYDQQGGAVPNGAEIDRLTTAECPQVRTDVLKVAGITSFLAL